VALWQGIRLTVGQVGRNGDIHHLGIRQIRALQDCYILGFRFAGQAGIVTLFFDDAKTYM
jgi:hypothetical protein